MNSTTRYVKEILAEKEAQRIDRDGRHWTLRELMDAEVETPLFYVGGAIPEGLTGVIAPGKIGKSFLMSGVALSICNGSSALGFLPTEKAEVLYIDLEQNPGRSKSRWKQVLCGDDPPEGLHIFYQWKRLDQGGLQAIEKFLDENRRVKVVIIDVFAKVKPTTPPKGINASDQEYQILATLKELADKKRIAIVFIHHTNRNSKAADILDTISGTGAMSQCPDALWFLSRPRSKREGKLYITGRAVSEALYNLIWSPSIGTWTICGQGEE